VKTIIIYESLHGSTEKCAKILYKLIKTDIQMARLKDSGEISLDEFDTVIIGGSIHNGVIQLRIENFIQKNHEKLLGKKLGLYLCCMEEGEMARMQFEKAYPAEIRGKAVAKGLFGGELNLGKMNFFEKRLTRKITGIKSSVSKINQEEIRFFAEKMNRVIF
jgi:menaquinone-dependent protoporphyrinogen oxidase